MSLESRAPIGIPETCRCKRPRDINECCCKDEDGDPCCTTECPLPGDDGNIELRQGPQAAYLHEMNFKDILIYLYFIYRRISQVPWLLV